jgi:hypothetical protein
MVVARAAVPLLLAAGVLVGLFLNSIVAILKFAIVLLLVWGVPITLLFIWRRVTERAVVVQVFVTLLLIAVVPSIVSSVPSLAQSSALTLMTRERLVTSQVAASAADVAQGLATAEGKTIAKTRRIEPVSVYFEEGVVRVDPKDPNSPKTGKGLFRGEVYLLALLGFDVAGFSAAQLLTTRYMVDFLLPVIVVVVMSLLTRPTDPVRVARLYARMKTPVAPTPEEDAMAVEASYANPTRYDHLKLFPNSNWEFTKWDKVDAIGFLVCCALVGVVLLVFKGVLVVGS